MNHILFVLTLILSGHVFAENLSFDQMSGNYSEKRRLCGEKISVEDGTIYFRPIANRFYGQKCLAQKIASYKVLECRANKCFVRGSDDLKSIESIGGDLILNYKSNKRLLINNKNINVSTRILTRKVSMSADSWYQGEDRILKLLRNNFCASSTADVCEVTNYECNNAVLNEMTRVVHATCSFTRHQAYEINNY